MLKESAELVILWVTFDSKMTFEKHLRSVSSAEAHRLSIMRKSWQAFHDRSLLLISFWSFVLPVLEYCSAVWGSAADSNLKLLDRDVRSAVFFSWWCFGVQPRTSSICCSVVHAQCILRAVHYFCRTCRLVLPVVLWLLIGTRLRLLVAEFLSTVEPLCPS